MNFYIIIARFKATFYIALFLSSIKSKKPNTKECTANFNVKLTEMST